MYKYIFLIILLIIIFLLINIFLHNFHKNDNEHFTGIAFQSGISGIQQTGTITFTTPFTKTPSIFTQIIGTADTSSNIYSVQIFNITDTSFNYSKNKVGSNPTSEYDITHVSPSMLEPFNWIAFG